MPRFAANLTMMFNEWPFLDRFAVAADAGFTAVEFLFPYEFPPDVIAERLAQHGLTLALFNCPPGAWDRERGLAVLPDRRADFEASIETALVYARATGVGRLHLMAGLAPPQDPSALAAYERAILHTCDRVGEYGIDVLLEPLNTRDVPGYFLNDFDVAAALIRRLARPNLKLQFDIYHRQIIHGDVVRGLEALLSVTGHVQVASVPERHEPGTGELDDAFVFRTLDRLGYDGYVGAEYRPKGKTVEGLSWLHDASAVT